VAAVTVTVRVSNKSSVAVAVRAPVLAAWPAAVVWLCAVAVTGLAEAANASDAWGAPTSAATMAMAMAAAAFLTCCATFLTGQGIV
jgi:hypothetical protein